MKEKVKKVFHFLKKRVRLSVIIVTLLFGVLLFIGSYSYAFYTISTEKENVLSLAAIRFNYVLNEQYENEMTLSFTEQEISEFPISIQANNLLASSWQLYYVDPNSTDIAVYYQEEGSFPYGNIDPNGNVTVTLVIQNRSGKSGNLTIGVQGGLVDKELILSPNRIRIDDAIYQDESGANVPKLVDGMIPVTYNGTNWVKADIVNKWYDYNSQEWANTVTVTETNRSAYMSAEAGTIIPMSDINTMWVWIPRYEYMYTNLGTQYAGGTQDRPGEIKVNFLKGTSTNPSDTKNYKVHPAFTFGGTELSGIWVGKFETTGTLASACTNESCDISNIVIKPNVKILNYQNVSTYFYSARSMQMNSSNPYGFRSTSGNVHMSKNSEWSAIAYLSQSRYGKYGNSKYTGADKEIAINNCSNFITGIGGDTVSAAPSSTSCTTNTYTTAKGQAASTTGNITGIYDISGAGAETVMGNYNNLIGSSGFSTMPETQYYDLYTTTNLSTACNGGVCYGHALSETSTWYKDASVLISSSNPWIVRGGGVTTTSPGMGAFYISHNAGPGKGGSSRIVVTP